ncbi:MAG: YybH family protein, partial [Geminicoccaceae bacterium]
HARGEALRTKDAEALAADYATRLVSYDRAPPLATRGIDRLALERWLAGWDGPVNGEMRELRIDVSGDVAFSASLNRMYARAKRGKDMDLWVRATLGFRKIEGRWRIVHEHISVPFYMDGSERAALDLQPEPGEDQE